MTVRFVEACMKSYLSNRCSKNSSFMYISTLSPSLRRVDISHRLPLSFMRLSLMYLYINESGRFGTVFFMNLSTR